MLRHGTRFGPFSLFCARMRAPTATPVALVFAGGATRWELVLNCLLTLIRLDVRKCFSVGESAKPPTSTTLSMLVLLDLAYLSCSSISCSMVFNDLSNNDRKSSLAQRQYPSDGFMDKFLPLTD
jgi:hypothetical protein